jgi:hypothetical protein
MKQRCFRRLARFARLSLFRFELARIMTVPDSEKGDLCFDLFGPAFSDVLFHSLRSIVRGFLPGESASRCRRF